MAKALLEHLWTERKESVLIALDLIKYYYKEEKSNETQSDTVTIQAKLDKANSRLTNLIAMRADGEISKDEYQAMRSPVDEEIKKLQKALDEIPQEKSNPKGLDIEGIRSTLNSLVDFSGSTISHDVVNRFVYLITPTSDTTFDWYVNLNGTADVKATFTAEGRKKNCIIKLEEIEKISSVHRGENEDNAHFIKNPHIFTYLHMVLRLGGGDLNALVGLIGFTGGILLGIASLKKGFSLKRSYEAHKAEGGVLPTVMAALLILVVTVPALFKFSEEGPGSMRAPFWIALVIALVVGALAQKSRLCMVGGLRDAFMLKDFHLLYGFVAIFVVTLVGNLAMGKFHLGFALQPIAHSAHLWNLLGMVLVGWGSVLLGGCPLRQLILAAQGNGDSAVTVFGMLVGAALAHNFGLAGNPDSKSEAGELIVGGISTAGKIAVVLGLVVMLVVVILNLPKKEEAKA